MAATGTVTISGSITDLPGGDKTIGPITTTAAAALESATQVTLASGDNTITIPTGATCAIIIFDSASTTVKKLKGNAGDTGIQVTKTGSVKLDFDSTLPTLIINSSAADTSKVTTVIFV